MEYRSSARPGPNDYANAVLSTASFPLARPFPRAREASRPYDAFPYSFRSLDQVQRQRDADGFSERFLPFPLSAVVRRGTTALLLPSIVLSTLRPLPSPRCRAVPKKKKKKKCYFN